MGGWVTGDGELRKLGRNTWTKDSLESPFTLMSALEWIFTPKCTSAS